MLENNESSKDEDIGTESEDTGSKQPKLEDVLKDIETLRGDVAKYKKLAKDARAERDQLKSKSREEGEDSFKDLYQKQLDENTKLKDRVKVKEIQSELKTQLVKNGILPAAVESAIKLIDVSIVDYDDTDGVDVFTAETAAKEFKKGNPFFFETKVNATKNRMADPGDGAGSKEMTRAEFNKLPLEKRRDAALKFIITD